MESPTEYLAILFFGINTVLVGDWLDSLIVTGQVLRKLQLSFFKIGTFVKYGISCIGDIIVKIITETKDNA